MKRIALVLITFLSLGTAAAFAQESAKPPASSGRQMVNLNSATVPQLEDAARHRPIHGREDRRVPPEERRLQEGRGPDERPGHRREELPEAQAARHRRDASGRAIRAVAGRRPGAPACDRRPLGPRWPAAAGARLEQGSGYSLVECLFAITLFAIIAAASVPPLAVGTRAIARAGGGTIRPGSHDAGAGPGGGHGRRRRAALHGNAGGRRADDVRRRQPQRGSSRGYHGRRRHCGRRAHPSSRPSFAACGLEPVTAEGVLFSFTPLGTSSSGTFYVTGRDGSRFAVRVLGATGRARLLRYLPASDEWTDAE